MAKRTPPDAAPEETDEDPEFDLSEDAADSLEGQILIAMPNMRDPRFEQAIVLMCAHDPEHAMGVIVNKPLSDLTFGELLAQLDIDPVEERADGPVLFGGPVKTDRGLVLHTLDYRCAATMEITPELGLTATREILVDIGGKEPERPGPRKSILALGHAGWGPGQLESEIRQNVWLHAPADDDLIFGPDTGNAWKTAMQRLGVSEAMFLPEWADTRPDDAPLH